MAVSVGSVGAVAATAPTASTSSTSPISFPSRWVYLTTRPALPDATFTLDGVAYSTGTDGTVRIPTSKLTSLDQRLGFVSVVNAPLTRANFDRFEAGPADRPHTHGRRGVRHVTVPARRHDPRPAERLLRARWHAVHNREGRDGPHRDEPPDQSRPALAFKFDTVSTGPDAAGPFPSIREPAADGYWRDCNRPVRPLAGRAVQLHQARRFPDVDRPRHLDDDPQLDRRGTDAVDDSRLRQPGHAARHPRHVDEGVTRRAADPLHGATGRCRRLEHGDPVPTRLLPGRHDRGGVDTRIYSLHVAYTTPCSDSVPVRPSCCNVRTTARSATGWCMARSPSRVWREVEYQLRVEGAGFSGWRPVVVSRIRPSRCRR